MSKARARARAEREAQAAAERERRAVQQQRRQRRDAAKQKVVDAVPRPVRTRRPRGLLAAKRRRRLAVVGLLLVVLNLVLWPVTPSWGVRAAVALLTALVAPVIWTLAFDRR